MNTENIIVLCKSPGDLDRDLDVIIDWFDVEWRKLRREHELVKVALDGDHDRLAKSATDAGEIALAKVAAENLLAKHGPLFAGGWATTAALQKISDLLAERAERIAKHDELTRRSRRFFAPRSSAPRPYGAGAGLFQ